MIGILKLENGIFITFQEKQYQKMDAHFVQICTCHAT